MSPAIAAMMQMTEPIAIAPIMPPCPALPVDLRSIVQKSSVAIAMPETGLLLEPTSPTSLEETVAKKNPNTAMHTAPSSVTGMGGKSQMKTMVASTSAPMIPIGRSRSVRRPVPFPPP